MSELVWESPPELPEMKEHPFWQRLRDDLKSCPGEWARVNTNVTSDVALGRLMASCILGFDYEIVQRKNPYGDGQDVYARFNG